MAFDTFNKLKKCSNTLSIAQQNKISKSEKSKSVVNRSSPFETSFCHNVKYLHSLVSELYDSKEF